jgi:protein-tyrosine phosphatase
MVNRVVGAMRNLLHSYRHRRVLDRLRRMARPGSVLVVCQGNVCRSPYLAAVVQSLLPDIAVSSAGFVGSGRRVPEHGLLVASRQNVDLAAHQSRLLGPGMLRRADVVLVMDAHHARIVAGSIGPERVIVVGDLDPLPGESRTIRDPWQQPLEIFEQTYARLDRCGKTFAEVVRKAL